MSSVSLLENMIEMPDKALLDYCENYPDLKVICLNDDFWQRRYLYMYPQFVRFYSGMIPWHQYYLDTRQLLKRKIFTTIADEYVQRPDLLDILAVFDFYPSPDAGLRQNSEQQVSEPIYYDYSQNYYVDDDPDYGYGGVGLGLGLLGGVALAGLYGGYGGYGYGGYGGYGGYRGYGGHGGGWGYGGHGGGRGYGGHGGGRRR